MHVWERAVVDAGAALRIAAGCLQRSATFDLRAEPVSEPASSRARLLAGAAAELAVAGICSIPISCWIRPGMRRNGPNGRRW